MGSKKRKGLSEKEQQHEEEQQQQQQQQQQQEGPPAQDDGGEQPLSAGSSGDDEDGDNATTSDDDDDGSSSSGPEVSSEEEEGAAAEGDPDAFDKIDVDFQFFDPKASDFHGLKALLTAYLDGQQYDSSGLVDAVIAQSTVGTVVRTAEDDDPIAVMTALNTTQHKAAPWMAAARSHVLAKAREHGGGSGGGGGQGGAADVGQQLAQKLSAAWDAPGTGLLINERLINCPPQLAPPLVQALFSEVAWATEDEPTQELRDAFKFKQYILFTRVYTDPLPVSQEGGGGAAATAAGSSAAAAAAAAAGKLPKAPKAKKQKMAAGCGGGSGGPVIVYVRPEDEFFHAHATASFTYPVEGRAVGKDELRPMRLVLLLPAAKVAAARSALDAVVGNLAAAAQ